jgi:adenosylcobyric acid synthase
MAARRTPIMLMGCSSDAGKSFLAAGLCRLLARRGIGVAPFKAQNMSNHAAVTPGGGEIGRAQYLQALAARVTPEPRMNPVLLKPMADTASQVVVLGRVDSAAGALSWAARAEALWPVVRAALRGLLAAHELLVIEGAGSPAEVNLRASDIVNGRVALEAGADVYLVADIDRGGAFAHLLGTWEGLAPGERALVRGFVLNKFRGDATLLGDGPAWLEQRTGVPCVAVIPMLRHRLPEEDSLHHRAVPAPGTVNVALLAYPYAANLDEFDPLIHEPGVTVVPVREAAALDGYDAVVLPGSKHTAASLAHLRETGLAGQVARAAARGVPVLGVCGGLQILGREIRDPHGVEGGDAVGLGLLDVVTTLEPEKTTRQRSVRWLEGGLVRGYEIHHGRTAAGPGAVPHLDEGLGWRQGNVWGVYLHGLLENAAYRQWFLERLGWGGTAAEWPAVVDAELDRLAEVIAASGWPLPASPDLRARPSRATIE